VDLVLCHFVLRYRPGFVGSASTATGSPTTCWSTTPPRHDPAYFTELLDLELTLCDREPFNRVGFAWQLLAERPA
jgi:hypothetical protein